jgi:predicted transcriptional regulator
MTAQTSPRELARAIAEGATTAEAVAARVSVPIDRVRSVLRSMMDRGLLLESDGALSLTAIGERARRERP